MTVRPKLYTLEDQETWRVILHQHAEKRERQLCDIFLDGVRILNLSEEKIPSLEEVNKILIKSSGFSGVLVEGLEEGASFYRMLAQRQFPVGNFIRDRLDLSYTPAPDIVHDLYGHLPFYTNREYGDFCQRFGEAALEFILRPDLFRQFERFFWFTVEFGLIKTVRGLRIFGAGIASSTGECDYALSGTPVIKKFSIDEIRYQEFRIDQMQPTLFFIESPEQLYDSLGELCARVRRDA